MILRLIPFFLAAFLAFAPMALAAESGFFGPIVPEACHSCPCGFAGVIEIARHLMNFAVTFGVIVLTIMVAWGGFLYILSAANPESRSQANKLLTGAFIGMALILGAWLFVDFVMKALYNPEATFAGHAIGPWNSVIAEGGNWCIESKPGQSLFDGFPLSTAPEPQPTAPDPNQSTPGGVTGTKACPSCISLADRGLSCSNSKSCTLDPGVAPKLVSLKNNFSGQWTITEAYPPTANHSNPCHQNGTCVDASFRGPAYTAANVTAFMTAAKKAGLRPVFESVENAGSCPVRDAVRSAGFSAYCKSMDAAYRHITGTHFSLYGN